MRSSITFLSKKISIICLRPLLIPTLVKLKLDTCYEAKIILWVRDGALLSLLFVSFGPTPRERASRRYLVRDSRFFIAFVLKKLTYQRRSALHTTPDVSLIMRSYPRLDRNCFFILKTKLHPILLSYNRVHVLLLLSGLMEIGLLLIITHSHIQK